MEINYVIKTGPVTRVGVITNSTDEEAVMDFAESVSQQGAVQIDDTDWGWEVQCEA